MPSLPTGLGAGAKRRAHRVPFGLVKFPEFAATSPQRAWLLGLGGAAILTWIAVRWSFVGLPIAAVVLAVYALTVRPRPFAASGVLFGTLPLLTWGIVDGLMTSASFNRNGGFCQSDPSAQVAIALAAYLATGAVTVIALRQIRS